MNIVLQTASYWPRLGGIETVARLLAEEFAALGHASVVLTETPGAGEDGGPTVLRQPSLGRRAAALREADVVLMFGMSLRFLPWPVLLQRPLVISHQTWYGSGGAALLKRAAGRLVRNIAASQAIADALGAPSTVIPNPYDDGVFVRRDAVARVRDLVFVGRIVPDKGLALLIEALALLAREGLRLMLTVIGSGPDEGRCRAAAAAAGVAAQVEWVGSQAGEALAVALNGHRVMVVPSVWHEPFGIVALEGMACGCVVVGSACGGLPEAIGPGGRTFPNGSARALAEALREALAQAPHSPAVKEHLRRHTRRAVALRYLEVLQDAAR